jgi:hypothetical protein
MYEHAPRTIGCLGRLKPHREIPKYLECRRNRAPRTARQGRITNQPTFQKGVDHTRDGVGAGKHG